MPAFLEQYQTLLTWLAAGSAVMLLISILTLPLLAVLLPADFLQRIDPARDKPLPPTDWRGRHPAMRLTLRILKNMLGVLLTIAGLAMLVLPGQGLITLAFALLLLDLPGKRKLQARLLRSPRLIKPINKLRVRLGRAPLEP